MREGSGHVTSADAGGGELDISRLVMGENYVEISGDGLERGRIEMHEPNSWRTLDSDYAV